MDQDLRPLDPGRSDERRGTPSAADSPDLTLKIAGLIEPDGMWRFDLDLIPKHPVSLDRLRLVIPLDPAHAGLMHWYPLPRNWPNVTFFDRAFQNSGARPPKWESPFTPFVWIGDEERGLEWFCESDETWRPESQDRRSPCGNPMARSCSPPT